MPTPLLILLLAIAVYAQTIPSIKDVMEEAISAMEQDSFVLEKFEDKIDKLCLAQNKQACNILLYIKFAHNAMSPFLEKLSLRLQQNTAKAFSVLFAEYLQFIAKNPIKYITPIEVPSIKSCVEKSGNCRNAGYLHQNLHNGDKAYTLFLWSKGCQNHDIESCKMIAEYYASVDYAFSPDSALKYAEKSCKAKDGNKCYEKERIYEEIENICKISSYDGSYGGLGLPHNELHQKCIQNICKNIKSKEYYKPCNVSDFIVYKSTLRTISKDLFNANILRCLNEEWSYCYSAGGNLYEETGYAGSGTSFHILFLLYMGCSHGFLDSCGLICELQQSPWMIPFDKSILTKMNIKNCTKHELRNRELSI